MGLAEQLYQIEKDHCISGKLPADASADSLLYSVQVHDWNARKAEALARSETVDPLLKIRSFYMRGKIEEASTLLLNLKSRSDLTHEHVELLVEEARLANSQAHWEQTIVSSSLAIEMKPSAVSLLSLYQIRAVALFELGELILALNDLENVDSLLSILPKSAAGFYAKVLKARIYARTRGFAHGRYELNALWKTKDMNGDLILTLLRAETDMKRIQGENSTVLAIASYAVSQHLGDLLYSGLALVDLFYSLPVESRVSIRPMLDEAKKSFVRVNRLCDEVDGALAPSTTASAIALAQAIKSSENITLVPPPQFLLLSELAIVIDLNAGILIPVETGKALQALALFARESVQTKADLFLQLWGKQKYAPHLHDNLIWNLLSRLRKKFHIHFSVEKQTIEINSKLLVINL